ncbi:MAG: DUF2225 domain-containing protein [Treponema sp.]|nr:DUF2225 domain-containing protein [Treponema sp.]
MVAGVKKATKKPAISYWSKKTCMCPICHKPFPREEMLSGNGRMIAGNLTEELHRLYEPSAKFGQVYPIIYAVGACPICHAAFFWNDFDVIDDKSSLHAIDDDEQRRKELVSNIFPHYRLDRERTLYDGAAMYLLALCTYDKVDASYIPTLKRGIICLRLAWICQDLDKEWPDHNFSVVSDIFYKKAIFFYQQAVVCETERTESSSSLANSGPDIDKNYGWDGVIYLCGLLEYKYGQHKDPAARVRKLEEYKTAIARLFGLGKSSKNKPGPLLEHSRNLYDMLNKEIEESKTITV